MKILQQNSLELIIEEKPTGFIFIFFIIWGSMFIGIPLLNILPAILANQKDINNFIPFSFVVLFPVIGFLVIFHVFQTHIFMFDKIQNLLIHHSKTFFGTQTKKYFLNNIIQLQINRYSKKSGYYYKLELVGLTKQNISINRLGSDSLEEVKRIGYILEDFLKVSLVKNQ